jgi:hypothetical protein
MAKSILTETNNFLENYQNKNKFYQIKALENYESQGTIVTGASPAILPMRISTIGRSFNKNGKKVDQRISFTLLINPDSWNQSKTQSSQINYTRNGWVVQLWGPNQDTISSTGKTAAMMTHPTGLDNLNAEMSFAYLNFMSLMSAYRSNGYLFEDFVATNELTRCIKMVYGVEIAFDNQILMGHFNNFTLDEDAERPFVFNYNFEFIVSTLSPSSQIRGHYQTLPTYENDLITGTGSDPYSLTLVADPYTKKASSIAPPKPGGDKTTEKLWGTRTGLTMEQAFNMGLTDGSIEGNLQLRRLLMEAIWDKNRKAFFINNSVNGRSYWTPGVDIDTFLKWKY